MIFDVKFPILGFDNTHRMKLEKIDNIFMRLSDADHETPVFTVVNPFLLREYEFEVPLPMKIELDLENSNNIFTANIMVINTPIQLSTINFLAPVVFNFDNCLMGQIVLDSVKYPEYSLAEPISNFVKPIEQE